MPIATPFPDAYASYAALGESPASHTVTITSADTAYSSAALTPGVYRMWIPGGAADDTLVWKRSATATSPTVASPDADGEAVHQQPANVQEFVRVTTEFSFLWVKLLTGASKTLRLSRISD